MGVFKNIFYKFKSFLNRESISLHDENILDFLGITSRNKRTISETTYFTCLRLLSETMGKMPLKYYQTTGNGKIRADPDHTTYTLTVRPNNFMTPTTFWSTVEANRQHYGNAYVWIRRAIFRENYGGEYGVDSIWVLPSNHVHVVMDNKGIFADAGKLYYEYVDKYSGQSYVFPQEDVMHFKTSSTFDGIMGKPVKEILKDTIDGAKAGEDFIKNINENGMTSATTLQYSEDLDSHRIEKLRTKYNYYLKTARKNNGVIPLPPGLKLVPVNMKLTDAQFYELQKYSALQIAAAFGIKPNQLNNYEKSSYANSETQQLAFLVETMAYHLKAYEEEINYKVLSWQQLQDGYWYRFNEKAILRTDAKTQSEILCNYVQNGVYKPNEARDLLQLEFAEGGDRLIVNGNFIPLIDVGKQYGVGGEET